jgi:hypothetical protein
MAAVEDRATKLALDEMVARVALAGAQISRRGALIVQSGAQRRLHEGYGVLSGAMRRSVHTEGPTPRGEGVYATRVGPSVIYARRFELGYTGPDTLGRVFAQQPRPFMTPAVREARPAVAALAATEWARAIRG